MKDIQNFSLLQYNTFGIDEDCRRFVEFDTEAELHDVLLSLTDADRPLLVIGGGSNLLLTGRYEGTVLRSAIKGIDVTDDGDAVLVRCGSGVVWDDFVAFAVDNSLYGAENLSIIPGDVGASAVQNIGAYGSEVKDIIHEIECLRVTDAEKVVIKGSDCGYGYRQSRFKQDWKGQYIITHVTYRLSKTFVPHVEYGNIQTELQNRGISNPTAKDIRNAIIDIRNAKLPDPKVEGNAGSFFMNPVVPREQFLRLQEQYPDMPHYHVDDEHEKIPAGWMIDQCGWKGRGVSPAAAVHTKQALVLVNRGGAKGSDIVALSDAVCRDVKEKFGIDIHPEVNFV